MTRTTILRKLTPRERWDLIQMVIRHDKTFRKQQRAERGSEQILVDKIKGNLHIEATDDKIKDSLVKLRQTIQKHNLSESTQADFGNIGGERTAKKQFLENFNSRKLR